MIRQRIKFKAQFRLQLYFVLIRGLYAPNDTLSTSLPLLRDKKKWSRFVCEFAFNSSIGRFRSHLTFSQSPVPYIISRPSRLHSNNSAISRANKQSQCMKRYLFLISPVRQTMHTELEKKKRPPNTSPEWRVMHAGQEWIILNHQDYRNKDEESSEIWRVSPAGARAEQTLPIPIQFPSITFNYQTLLFQNDLFYHYRRADCPQSCILH